MLKEMAKKVTSEELKESESVVVGETIPVSLEDDKDYQKFVASCEKKAAKKNPPLKNKGTIKKDVIRGVEAIKKWFNEKSFQISEEKKKIIFNIIFALSVAFAIPLLFPVIMEGYAQIFKSDFAISISKDSKGWVLIAQTITVFIGMGISKKKAYLSMALMIIGLFLIELLIWLLSMVPIW